MLLNILLRIGIPCDVGHYYSQQHDQQNDCAGNNGDARLAEPDHRILEEANGLCFELFVFYVLLVQGLKGRCRQIFNFFRQVVFAHKS